MGTCKNVLIVEDDQAVRSMLKDVLEIEGYNIYIAKDGSEGIEQLKIIANEPCVILLDLMMPGTNGWKFLDFQRSDPNLKHIPVIVCSAYEESARSVHPDDIVPKPVNLTHLLNVVHKFCA